MNIQTKTILILIGVLAVVGCGEEEPSKMELLQEASDRNLSQARMFNDGYTDWHEIVPNMQTAAANVDYYVHEVKEEQKHRWWWTVGAFVFGLLAGRSEGKEEE